MFSLKAKSLRAPRAVIMRLDYERLTWLTFWFICFALKAKAFKIELGMYNINEV